MQPSADNSDFTNIWNQLLQRSTADATVTGNAPQPNAGSKKDSSGSQSPVGGSASLQSAAEKLGRITLPNKDLMDVGCHDNPPTGILVDLTEASPLEKSNKSERLRLSLIHI